MFDLIVAMNPMGIIGLDDSIPWRVPEDLAYFRKMTLGKTIIMGRKTLSSLPNRRPLPDRTNWVITRDTNMYQFEDPLWGQTKYMSLEDAITAGEDAIVIGGGQIYEAFLPRCNKIYATIVDWSPGDDDSTKVYFPLSLAQLMMEYNIKSESEEFVSAKSGLKYKFMVFCGK
jgi:dihydrofolate reductase